jgi:hypothetical protein
MRNRSTKALSIVLVVLGALLLIRTAAAGGSGFALGYVFGAGLLVAGVLRLYLLSR